MTNPSKKSAPTVNHQDRKIITAQRYAVAISSVILATLIRHLLNPLWHQGLIFITFYPAIIFSAWYGGMRPGIVATGLSAIIATIFWIPFPFASITDAASNLFALFLFVTVGIIFSILNERLLTETSALTKLNELSSRLWPMQNLHDGLSEILAASIELLGANMGNVQILNADRGVLNIAVHRGFKQDFLDFFREVSTKDDSACGRALRSGQRIIIDDVTTDVPYTPLRPIAAAAGYRSVQSTPLISRDGTPLGMISTHWRVPHRPSEQDLRRLDLYMRQAVDFIGRCRIEENLKKTTEDLKNFNQELEQFAYICSHDLQEPLRTISSYVDLFMIRKKGPLDPNEVKYLKFIEEGAVRAQGLIKGLLEYASITAKDYPLENHDIQKLLEQAISNLNVLIKENSGARITYDSLPTLNVNSMQITQLFQNLISNSIRYKNSEPPHIHVSAAQQNGKWVFSVQDNGIGIPPEYKNHIFMIFKRLHPKNQYPGIGIGLSVCKKIVQRHGGEIWVESEPPKGCTFYFSLIAETDTKKL